MTTQAYANKIAGKSLQEVLALPELLVTEMQQDGVFLAFCTDKMYFHVMGARNQILQINIGEKKNFDICIDDDLTFRPCREDGENARAVIRLEWGIVTGQSAGYKLTTNWASVPLVFTGNDGHASQGILFDREAIR